ncbi:MAG: flagellar motor switch protein FliG [Planctomycetaceae bacterium]|nr:flagellar motor switch protein FliG [Planctomycetaceae bacterium]MCH2594778.1 flagellar motor switch protein FliG [Pirellulales bacterium]HCK40501.1 flagellar motor switch protein FliG [Planctomycetaceae bacterium]|tara:strand:- start:59 stop:1051 length:993 start_codon:yes stop_codon:yes gene_type:complete
MSDIHKAAVLLTALPEEEAASVMALLDTKQVEQVSISIARLRSTTADEQEQVILEFAESNPGMAGTDAGGLDRAKALVQRALGKNANDTIDSICQSIEEVPFSFLRHIDSQNILTYIADEHPQTIALILSHLPAASGAEILGGLSSDRQLQVVQRISSMGQTSPEVIKQVEQGLERRMSSVMSQSFENTGGVGAVAEMLNVSDRTTERTLLENLSQEDPGLVEEIRRLMFIFEDIGKFNDKEIQTLLKNVESSQWSLALKGASPDLKEKIFGNMSQRAGEMLKEEMEFSGAVKLSVVEGKQQEIVDIVRRLEDTGELEINAGGEEEELVQ